MVKKAKKSTKDILKLLKYKSSFPKKSKTSKLPAVSTSAKTIGTIGTIGALGSLAYLFRKRTAPKKKSTVDVATSPIVDTTVEDISKLKELLGLCDQENKILRENFSKAENSRKEWENAFNHLKSDLTKCSEAYKNLKKDYDRVIALR